MGGGGCLLFKIVNKQEQEAGSEGANQKGENQISKKSLARSPALARQ
jgi:hypothetical protein